ncbi:MAG TPA: hypothetical protein VK772_12875, partial [Puia sp.]|nr:hypothetical protein [Puia sp.]
MIRFKIATLLLLLIFFSCRKSVPVNDVIQLKLTSPEAMADGSSTDTIIVLMPQNTDSQSELVTLKTATGLFSNGADTLSAYANRIDLFPGKRAAIFPWTSSLRSGLDTIWASTNTDPQVVNNFTFTMNPSIPSSILLSQSAFSVVDSFAAEVTITGTLISKSLQKVSLGTMVSFADNYIGGGAVGGSYRQIVNQS